MSLQPKARACKRRFSSYIAGRIKAATKITQGLGSLPQSRLSWANIFVTHSFVYNFIYHMPYYHHPGMGCSIKIIFRSPSETLQYFLAYSIGRQATLAEFSPWKRIFFICSFCKAFHIFFFTLHVISCLDNVSFTRTTVCLPEFSCTRSMVGQAFNPNSQEAEPGWLISYECLILIEACPTISYNLF